jgi:hypothetical protein
MKKTIELFVHSSGRTEPVMITVAEDDTIANLLAASGAPEGSYLFVEDRDKPLPIEKKVDESGIKAKDHVHVTRCLHIDVAVSYNGVTKNHSFPPAQRVKHVLKWALDEFGLKGVDAQNKVLRIVDGRTDWELCRHYPMQFGCFTCPSDPIPRSSVWRLTKHCSAKIFSSQDTLRGLLMDDGDKWASCPGHMPFFGLPVIPLMCRRGD